MNGFHSEKNEIMEANPAQFGGLYLQLIFNLTSADIS